MRPSVVGAWALAIFRTDRKAEEQRSAILRMTPGRTFRFIPVRRQTIAHRFATVNSDRLAATITRELPASLRVDRAASGSVPACCRAVRMRLASVKDCSAACRELALASPSVKRADAN